MPTKDEVLQVLDQKISACTKCEELAVYRQASHYMTVPGTGNSDARVMIIGEAPGENEAKQGKPFVGKAGNLLTNILKAAGFERDDVFIANILKCRPPGNRDPEPDEACNCRNFLDIQIRCIDPDWILCFGRIASVYLLGLDPETRIGELRGRVHEYQCRKRTRKVICTYHPSFLLRNPAAKSDVWHDLQPVISALQSKPASV